MSTYNNEENESPSHVDAAVTAEENTGLRPWLVRLSVVMPQGKPEWIAEVAAQADEIFGAHDIEALMTIGQSVREHARVCTYELILGRTPEKILESVTEVSEKLKAVWGSPVLATIQEVDYAII